MTIEQLKTIILGRPKTPDRYSLLDVLAYIENLEKRIALLEKANEETD